MKGPDAPSSGLETAGGSVSGPAVFISYARADRPRVAPMAQALQAAGCAVWWDAMIDGGAEFARTIEAKLAGADAVIVVWSPTSIASDWVRDEAAHARDRKRLLPVSLDGTAPPLGFRQYHAVDLSAWRGDIAAPEMEMVIRAVATLADVPAETLHLPPKRSATGLSRRSLLIAGSGAVVVAAAAGGLAVFRPWSTGVPGASVAVLPFTNLSGNPAQAYFSDGLSEEVRAALMRIPQLKVAAPTSSDTFRDQESDAKDIGTKLGVAFLLEGSVRRADDKVRIAASLIDATTGFSRWSQTFDRTLTDVFAIQSEIAATVADALAVEVEVAQHIVGGTTSVVAYDAYLQGRALYNADAGEASDRGALAQFDAAVFADPTFASAHAARSRSISDVASSYGQANQLIGMYNDAIAAALRAIAIAPQLAAAYWALAHTLFYGKLDIRGSAAPYDRAYKLGNGDADLGIAYALYCARVGRRQDAQSAVDHALTLDPLNARAYRAAGVIQSAGGDQTGSLPLLQHALALNPKLAFAHFQIGTALIALGRTTEARTAYAAEPNVMFNLTGLAIADRKLGNLPAASKSRDALVTRYGDNALYQQAEILAQWGDVPGALAALARAQKVGDSGLTYLLTDPLMDPLRGQPAFSRMLSSLGFA